MLNDIEEAFVSWGQKVRGSTPAADQLIETLRTLSPASARADAAHAVERLETLRAELADPATAAAAFDDLTAVVADPVSSLRIIDGRLAVLACALELADRSVHQVCQLIGGIVDDQAFEIDVARHELDGTEIARRERPDEQAGLDVAARLELSRRYLQHPAQTGHHVVWVAYEGARVETGDWREQVGLVEFFDGPTMVNAIKNPGQEFLSRPLPAELTNPRQAGGISDDLWPDQEDVPCWVAARVDLGPGPFSDPVRIGKEQADAIVQFAIFRMGDSTWKPLSGYVHCVDGAERSWRGPFYLDSSRDDFRAEWDKTAEAIHDVAAQIGPQLPIVDPVLRRLLGVIGALNVSTSSSEPDLIAQDVRVIAFVGRQCEQPSWTQFLRANNATTYAFNRILNEIYGAVADTVNDVSLNIPERDQLTVQIRYWHRDRGGLVRDRRAALALLPRLLASLPAHHPRARRLREVGRRTQTVSEVSTWVEEIVTIYSRKIARVERFRNGLTHGGAAQAAVAHTVRHLINDQARFTARVALEAALEGRSIKGAFIDQRTITRGWRREIATSDSVPNALFSAHDHVASTGN